MSFVELGLKNKTSYDALLVVLFISSASISNSDLYAST